MPHTENPSLRPAKRDTKGLCCDPQKAVIRGTGNPPNGFKGDYDAWPDSAFFPRKKCFKEPASKTIRAGKK